jgi:uncharacterized membrane protein
MEPTQPLPLDELKKLRKPVRNSRKAHIERLSSLEKMAMSIASRVGSMTFFILVFIATLAWLGWNTFAPIEYRFDPFPAFVLWLFISNITQLLLMPLIMVSQNLQARYAEVRAEEEYEINLKAEREIEVIISHLEKQQAKLDELLAKTK